MSTKHNRAVTRTRRHLRKACAALVGAAFTGLAAPAAGEPGGASPSLLRLRAPSSDWAPNYTVFPYNLWQVRVTGEQIDAQRESCQWFNAQYGTLMTQIVGFQNFLGGQHDYWTAPGVQAAGDAVRANVDQSAAFLDPRAHTLYITNYPDQSQYSPLYNGDSIYHLWYQLTQISDKIAKQQPSGVINANVATANVYGNVIRDSGVCNGA